MNLECCHIWIMIAIQPNTAMDTNNVALLHWLKRKPKNCLFQFDLDQYFWHFSVPVCILVSSFWTKINKRNITQLITAITTTITAITVITVTKVSLAPTTTAITACQIPMDTFVNLRAVRLLVHVASKQVVKHIKPMELELSIESKTKNTYPFLSSTKDLTLQIHTRPPKNIPLKKIFCYRLCLF